MEDLEKLYSPSLWTKRFSSSEEIISYHLKFISEGKLLQKFNTKLIKKFQKVKKHEIKSQTN